MKRAAVIVLALLLCARSVGAQDAAVRSEARDSHKGIKLIIGIAALAVGTAVAANSSEKTTVSSINGTLETSTFSSSQLITGLAIAGTGGFLLWDALRDHTPARPGAVWGVGVAKGRGGQVFWRRMW
jgi:hypothetical protein